MQNIIDKCITFIEQEEYYLAHEALEELWRILKKEENCETLLVKGFTNGATSLELAKRGRKAASLKTWDTFLKYHDLVKKSSYNFDNLSKIFIEHHNRF